MRIENTICDKITRSMRLLEQAVNTGKLDVGSLGNLLHEIRSDAYKMEHGLKLRKEVMSKVAGLEEEYQEKKGKRVPTGVNKIANREEKRVNKRIEYEFIVKEKGEIVYQNTVFAGAISVVEEISDVDEDGAIEGTTQKFFFGHDLAIFFAFDQLRQAFEGRRVQLLQTLKSTLARGVFEKDPGYKKRILALCNGEVSNDQQKN